MNTIYTCPVKQVKLVDDVLFQPVRYLLFPWDRVLLFGFFDTMLIELCPHAEL